MEMSQGSLSKGSYVHAGDICQGKGVGTEYVLGWRVTSTDAGEATNAESG
jgi:hypothetical protein